MPLRPWTRDREGVLPPNLDDRVGPDHPVRFVAAFVEELTGADWATLGITPGGHPGGAPAYDPTVLLAAWLYGFMSGVRSWPRLQSADPRPAVAPGTSGGMSDQPDRRGPAAIGGAPHHPGRPPRPRSRRRTPNPALPTRPPPL